MNQQGTIFNIQRYTIHDGPGIRTEVFLKGCPLSCKWCGNPESRSLAVQPGVYTARCIGKEQCGLCADVCGREGGLLFGDDPEAGALASDGADPKSGENDGIRKDALTSVNRALCTGCMKCADTCPADAIRQWGRTISVEEAMKVIRKDRSYYEESGGGVTLSGGEPLMQPDFTAALLRQCRQEGIHTCLESTFCMDWSIIEKAAPHADMLITDIKHMDPAAHREHTGVSNEKILDNLRRLAQLDIPIIIRIPVIPNFNDDMDNMEATADFIIKDMENRVRTLQLLGFMRLGEEKYRSLGMPYPMADVGLDREAFQQKIEGFSEYFNRRGIHCTVGTKEK